MRFWDSSALVPLLYRESASEQALELYRQDGQILVWVFTTTEIMSALCRKRREEFVTQHDFQMSRKRLRLLKREWLEVQMVELVRDRAERLLEVHPLRASDALQLASALVATEDRPEGFEFVTYDEALATAAEKEGFQVLPWDFRASG